MVLLFTKNGTKFCLVFGAFLFSVVPFSGVLFSDVHCISKDCFTRLSYQKIVSITENGSSQEDNKTDDGCILEICQLEFAGSKLDPPTDLRIGRRGLKPHCLPVGNKITVSVLNMYELVWIPDTQ